LHFKLYLIIKQGKDLCKTYSISPHQCYTPCLSLN